MPSLEAKKKVLDDLMSEARQGMAHEMRARNGRPPPIEEGEAGGETEANDIDGTDPNDAQNKGTADGGTEVNNEGEEHPNESGDQDDDLDTLKAALGRMG